MIRQLLEQKDAQEITRIKKELIAKAEAEKIQIQNMKKQQRTNSAKFKT